MEDHVASADDDVRRSPKRRRVSTHLASKMSVETPRISIDSPTSAMSNSVMRQLNKDNAEDAAITVAPRGIPNEYNLSVVSTPGSHLAESDDSYPPSRSSPVPFTSRPNGDSSPEVRYKAKYILRGHKHGVAAVKFSPDGKWIASCCAYTQHIAMCVDSDHCPQPQMQP